MGIWRLIKQSYLNVLQDVLAHFQTLNIKIHPITLTYNSQTYEQAFEEYYRNWMSHRSRIAGVTLIIAGLLDTFLVLVTQYRPGIELSADLFLILTGLTLTLSAHTQIFKHYHQLILATMLIAFSALTVSLSLLLSEEYYKIVSGYIYLPALGCCILGLTYTNSLFNMLVIVALFNLILLTFDPDKAQHLFRYNNIYFIYIIIAVSINYLFEYSMRKEFIYQQTLDLDRKKYLKLSQSDVLTGLENRFSLLNKLNRLLNLNLKSNLKGPIGLLIFIDLNGFKEINDEYGHLIGDEVLKIIAQRLTTACHSNTNVVTRLGGDEFVIYLNGIYQGKDLNHWLGYISDCINQPIQLDNTFNDQTLSVSASLGHSIVSTEHSDIEDIIQQADQNMYQQKQHIKHQINL